MAASPVRIHGEHGPLERLHRRVPCRTQFYWRDTKLERCKSHSKFSGDTVRRFPRRSILACARRRSGLLSCASRRCADVHRKHRVFGRGSFREWSAFWITIARHHCAVSLYSIANWLRRRDRPIRLRPAIAIELPGVAHVTDHVEVEVAHDDVVGVAGGRGQDLAARVAEVALAVEFTDAPGIFPAGPVDGAYEITVGDGVCGLFQ